MKRSNPHYQSIGRYILGSIVIASVLGLIAFGLISYAQDIAEQRQFDSIQNSRFLVYTNDGQLYGTNFDLVVDKETGVQYIHTGNGISPLYNSDGSLYVTIE